MSEHIVFRFTVLNCGEVYPKTGLASLSVFRKRWLILCIKPHKFEFIFSYYCNLWVSFFYFVLYIRYVFLIIFYYTFLLYTSTYYTIDIFDCYVCNLVTIMFICTDFIEVDDWNNNIANMGLC